MTWFKVDDSFADHPKVKRIPRPERVAAIGLWTLAGAWAAKHLTDGHIPDYMVEELAGSDAHAKLLVDVGLWHIAEGGYVFHNWDQWQPTREAVESRRRSEADRKAQWRQSKQDKATRPASVPTGHVADSARDTSGTDGVVTQLSALPDPTRPDPKDQNRSSARADAEFNEFWAMYPRKIGKQKARAKFIVNAKRVGGDTIIAGLRAQLPALTSGDAKFIPYPQTWLERGSWDDVADEPRRERGWWE